MIEPSPLRLAVVGIVVSVVGGAVPALLFATPRGRRSAERVARRYGVGPWTVSAAWLVLVGLVAAPVTVGVTIDRLGGYAGALVVAAGLALLASAAANLPTYLRVRGTPTTDAMSAGPGLVELEGTVRADDPPTAPLSGAPAVCYQLSVQEREERGDYEGWTQVAFVDERVPFTLRDHTGRVAVDPAGADFRLEAERRVETSPDEPLPDAVASLLDETASLDRGSSERRYAEHRLEPGTEAYVLGEARRDAGSAGVTVGDGAAFVVKPGDADSVTRAFHRVVVRGGLAGLALVAVGEALLLWPALAGLVAP